MLVCCLQKQLVPGQYVPAPKKMIEFSRRHQEAKLTKEQEEQLKQLQEDEADLEVRPALPPTGDLGHRFSSNPE